MSEVDLADAGGGNAGAEADANAGTEATEKTGDGTDQKSDGGADVGDKKELTLEQKFENLTTEHTTLATENTQLKSQLGKQSEHIGTLNSFSKMIKSDPMSIIKKIAKSGNIDLSKLEQSGTGLDVEKLFSGEATAEEQTSAITSLKSEIRADILKEVGESMSPLQEANLAARHSDWDERATARESISLELTSGSLSESELIHFASIGKDMPNALKAAGEKAVEDYVISLQDKTKGQLGTASPTATKASDGTQHMKDFLTELDVMS